MDSTTSKCKWQHSLSITTRLPLLSLLFLPDIVILFLLSLITLNLCLSGLKKHGAGLCSLLKRLGSAFNKDSADVLSALLDFLRQILNTETMVSTWFYGWFMLHVEVNTMCTKSVHAVEL